MVTPFGPDGGLDEEAAADLIRHLLANGSDGVVLAGTTGEGSTVTDDEDVALWELGVEVARDAGKTVIAGTGTQRHPPLDRADRARRGLRRGRRAGGHAVLQPAQPGRAAGPLRGRRGGHRPADRSPTTSRTARARTCPTTCWPSWPRSPRIVAVKQARYEDLAPIDGNGPSVRQRRRVRRGLGHGRHRRDPGGLPPGRRPDAADDRRARQPARRSRPSSSRCTRRCPWRRWRPRSRPR